MRRPGGRNRTDTKVIRSHGRRTVRAIPRWVEKGALMRHKIRCARLKAMEKSSISEIMIAVAICALYFAFLPEPLAVRSA